MLVRNERTKKNTGEGKSFIESQNIPLYAGFFWVQSDGCKQVGNERSKKNTGEGKSFDMPTNYHQ